MTLPFTEGPWEVSDPYIDEYGYKTVAIGRVDGGAGRFVEECIAAVYSLNHEHDFENNAKLIAGAPLMYHALKEIVEHSGEMQSVNYAKAVLARIDDGQTA